MISLGKNPILPQNVGDDSSRERGMLMRSQRPILGSNRVDWYILCGYPEHGVGCACAQETKKSGN
jgi:hypothetical protein